MISVRHGESSKQEVTMNCERMCLRECKAKLQSVFTINEGHRDEEIPDNDCYYKELRQYLDDEDLEICKKSESDLKKQSEQVSLEISRNQIKISSK